MSYFFQSTGQNFPKRVTEVNVTQLKAYYKFNEASGNVINQATTVGSVDALSGEDLTVTGATYQATGVGNFTYGMSFDGVNDKAVGNTALNWKFMSEQADFTVAFWVKPIDTVVNGRAIMATVDAGATNGFVFDYRTTGNLRFITDKATNAVGNTDWTGLSISAGNWYHIVHRHDNANDIFELFVNNVDKGNNAAVVETANTPDVPLQLMDTDYTGAAGGVLTEMSFWERKLTDDEITLLYNSGNGLAL